MMILSTIHNTWLQLLIFCVEKLDSLRKKLLVTGDVSASIVLLTQIFIYEMLVLVVGIPTYVISSYPSDILVRRGISVVRFRAYRVLCLVSVSGVTVLSVFFAIVSWWNMRQGGQQIVYTWSFADEANISALRFLSSEIEVKNGVVSMRKSPYVYGAGEVCQAIFEMSKPFHFSIKDRLVGWSAVATAGNLVVSFQLSIDNGATWYTWEKNAWNVVTRENVSSFTSEKDVAAHIGALPYTATGRDLIFRTRLLGDCNQPTSISSVSVNAQVPLSDNKNVVGPTHQDSRSELAITPSPSLVAAIASFTVSDQIPVPENIRIFTDAKNRSLVVSGKASAGAEVFVYFDMPHILLYRTRANEAGMWRIKHDQKFVFLAPGSHAVYAKARDPGYASISQSSEVVSFVLTDRQLPVWLLDLDTITVCAILVILVGGTLFVVYKERMSSV